MGYWSGKKSSSLKQPPSYGLPTGPCIMTSKYLRLSSCGLALMPGAGSLISLCVSLTIRLGSSAMADERLARRAWRRGAEVQRRRVTLATWEGGRRERKGGGEEGRGERGEGAEGKGKPSARGRARSQYNEGSPTQHLQPFNPLLSVAAIFHTTPNQSYKSVPF